VTARRLLPFLVLLLVGSAVSVPAGAEELSPATGLAAFDHRDGRWFFHRLGDAYPAHTFFYGDPGDTPLLGDWDCDGTATVGMYRTSNGSAYLRNSNDAGPPDIEFYFGIGSDQPLVGDWDGDGCDSLGVYRRSTGQVFLGNRLATSAADVYYYFGIPGDRPFAGDFDGDGVDSVGLHRPADGMVYTSNAQATAFADVSFPYGATTDDFIVGDWDGDGDDTVGLVRELDGSVHLRDQHVAGSGQATYEFMSGDLEVKAGGFSLPRAGSPVYGRIFPHHRVVAYYGNSSTRLLGVLGETGPEAAVGRVLAAAVPFATPERPVIGAFELIASVAQASAGSDGDYSAPTALADLQPWIDAARASGLLVILDIQPGRSSFVDEVKRYEPLLRQPGVGLALDPEWRMGPTQVPAQVIGSVDAAEVNEVSAWLSDIVLEEGLPEKLFLLHQFTFGMITNRDQLLARPGLVNVIHVDGIGSQSLKLQTYGYLHTDPPPWYNGLKLFIDEDTNMFTPAEVFARVDPIPDLITYQ
jgi:hypothetical protein